MKSFLLAHVKYVFLEEYTLITIVTTWYKTFINISNTGINFYIFNKSPIYSTIYQKPNLFPPPSLPITPWPVDIHCLSSHPYLWPPLIPTFKVYKTLQTTDETLMEMINVADYDVKALFSQSDPSASPSPRSPHERAKLKADRDELESFYLEVISLFLCY